MINMIGSAVGLSAKDKQTATNNMLAGTSILHGRIQGTIPQKAAATILPGTANQTVAAGQYLAGDQTIMGEPNLAAENIKLGTAIFGVAGNLAAADHIVRPCNISITDTNASSRDGKRSATTTINTSGYGLLILNVSGQSAADIYTMASVCGQIVAYMWSGTFSARRAVILNGATSYGLYVQAYRASVTLNSYELWV